MASAVSLIQSAQSKWTRRLRPATFKENQPRGVGAGMQS